MEIKGIVYCIHLQGVGHMKRMLMLCNDLLKFSHITFVQGGPEVNMTIKHPEFRHIKLPFISEMIEPPAILKDELLFNKALKVMKKRKIALFYEAKLSNYYDFVIIEQIPFSKLFWANEIISLIKAVKKINPKALIICSHKGTTREEKQFLSLKDQLKYENADKISADLIEKYYDKIMVHTDPRLVKLDDNFYSMNEIKDKILYTGFISNPLNLSEKIIRKHKHILVTVGSGLKFTLFINELLECIENLSDYTFTVIKGPMINKKIIDLLNNAEKKLTNLTCLNFVDNLDKELLKHSLVIAMAGFTLINIYMTNTPALVFPDSNEGSQTLLARKFSEKNFIRLMTLDDFTPQKLKKLIDETIENPPKPDFRLNTDGVKNAIDYLKKALNVILKQKKM